jgi:hypothetical protein
VRVLFEEAPQLPDLSPIESSRRFVIDVKMCG